MPLNVCVTGSEFPRGWGAGDLPPPDANCDVNVRISAPSFHYVARSHDREKSFTTGSTNSTPVSHRSSHA